MTSQKYHHLLQGFCYMFNEHWKDQSAVIATDTAIAVDLPENFDIHSYNDWKPLEAQRWSYGLKYALEHIPDGIVTLLLEDYFLNHPVNAKHIKLSESIIKDFPNDLLRFDLTSDRQFNGRAEDKGMYGDLDLVETPHKSEYQMSFQAGMWNRQMLIMLIQGPMTPWQTELWVKPPENMRVMGSKQNIVRYVNVVKSGGLQTRYSFKGISEKHLKVMHERGYIDFDQTV